MGGRASKINNPWNREGGEGHIFCKSYCVCVCGGGGGGECEEDQNSSISLLQGVHNLSKAKFPDFSLTFP